MRSVGDRIRHAVCFEVIGVLTVTPLVDWVFDARLFRVGVLALFLSLLATCWNYVYNVAFDRLMWRLRRRVYKRPHERVVHACVFEFGMLVITVPPVMWWLDYGLSRALSMAASVMVFYLLYTYVYNWLYDRLFPASEPGKSQY